MSDVLHWQAYRGPGMTDFGRTIAVCTLAESQVTTDDASLVTCPACLGQMASAMMGQMAGALTARRGPSIEERRKALKAGDVITDPALLAAGMRVRKFYTAGPPNDVTIAGVTANGNFTVRGGDGMPFHRDSVVMSRGVELLGWDTEEAEAKNEEAWHIWGGPGTDDALCGRRSDHITSVPERRALVCQGCKAASTWPPAPICNALVCDFHHDPKDPACVRAKHRTPPRGLPFKRHPKCLDVGWHAEKKLCLTCEDFIAEEMAERSPPKPARPEPHSLAPSGMTGPILARLR
jgi:hypothetical protein